MASTFKFENYSALGSNPERIVKASDGTLYLAFSARVKGAVDTTYQVQVWKSTDNGVTWSNMNFPTVTGYSQTQPSLAIDNSGYPRVAWTGTDSSNGSAQIKYATWNGSVWSSWVNIARIVGYSQSKPVLMIDSSNYSHVVWNGYDGTFSGYQLIKYAKNNATTTNSWGAYNNLGTTNLQQHQTLSSAYMVNNKVYVFFQQLMTTDSQTGTTSVGKVNVGMFTNASGSWVWKSIAYSASYAQAFGGINSVVVDSSNVFHIFFMSKDASYDYDQIRYATGTISGTTMTFSAVTNISTINGYTHSNPIASINAYGKVEVLWTGGDANSTSAYKFKYISPSGSWSSWIGHAATLSIYIPDRAKRMIIYSVTGGTFEIKVIDNKDTRMSTSPSVVGGTDFQHKIVKAPNGTLYAAYMKYNANGYNYISIAKSTNGGTSWSELTPPTNGDYHQYYPSIAIDSNNNLHLVYYGTDVGSSTTSRIKYVRYNGSTWSAIQYISNDTTYQQIEPVVVVDSSNLAHILWRAPDATAPSYYNIRYATIDLSNVITRKGLFTPNDGNYHQTAPAAIFDADGVMHVACQENSSGVYHVKYTTLYGDIVAPWEDITPDAAYNQTSARIDVDSSKKIHICWQGLEDSRRNSANAQTFGVYYTMGNSGSWSDIELVYGNTVYHSQVSDITVDDGGKAHITWQSRGVDDYSKYIDQVYYAHNVFGMWSAVKLLTELPYGYSHASCCVSGNDIHVVYQNSFECCFKTFKISGIKYLFKDGVDVKTYDGAAWSIVGDFTTIDRTTFDTYGLNNLFSIDDAALLLLTTPELILWTDEPSDRVFNLTAIPAPKLILPTGDIGISSVSSINNISLNATVSGAGDIKTIISVDSGSTWYTYNMGAWETINADDLSDVKVRGITPDQLALIDEIGWSALVQGSTVMRFGYYLEIADTSDSALTDALVAQFVMTGYWEMAIPGQDYTYAYPRPDVLKVTLLSNGDFKINY